MKHLFTTLFILFGFTLSAQETIIALWDFTNESGGLTETTYTGEGNKNIGNFLNGNVVDPVLDDNAVTVDDDGSSSGFSAKYLEGLDLGGSGKVHLSIAYKSWDITTASTSHFQLRVRDASNNNIATLKLEENKVSGNPDPDLKARIISNVYAANANGTQKSGGHFGPNTLINDSTQNVGITLDFDNNTYEIWNGAPTGEFFYNFGGVSGATPEAITGVKIDHLQISMKLLGAGDNYVIDQVKISTGEYENTLSKRSMSDADFSIYPNPVKDHIIISNASINDTVELFNVVGKHVKSIRIQSQNEKIDVSTLKSGVYFARLNNGNAFKILKK